MKTPRLFSLLTALTILLGATLRAADAPAPEKNGYTVTLDVRFDTEGYPTSLELFKSEDRTPGEVLNKMALALAMKTHLPPHLKDGKAEPFTARMPFFFPIEDDEGPGAQLAPMPHPRADVCVQPTYPQVMLDGKVAGGAIFELNVDEAGNISKLTTMRASHPEFERAAREAVEKWKFKPAQKDGHPVASRCRLAIVFDYDANMADLKWRVAPRPSLGSFVLVHTEAPAASEAAAPSPEASPAPAAAPAAPGK